MLHERPEEQGDAGRFAGVLTMNEAMGRVGTAIEVEADTPEAAAEAVARAIGGDVVDLPQGSADEAIAAIRSVCDAERGPVQ